VQPPKKKRKRTAKKKPEPMKLAWERREETNTIVAKEVAELFAKIREETRQENQDAKK
jgi:hypothetical protein